VNERREKIQKGDLNLKSFTRGNQNGGAVGNSEGKKDHKGWSDGKKKESGKESKQGEERLVD